MTQSEMNTDFYVRFWGVRGSTPCPGPDVAKYGGNTSCLEVFCGDQRIIFDAGTGLRYLGNQLVKEGPCDIDIFLTHTHLDHVCGMPFFKPFYSTENKFRIHSGHSSFGSCTKDALKNMMVAPLLPMDVEVFNADIDFTDFPCGKQIELPNGVLLKTVSLNHPNGATGYRIEFNGKSICYITDTEHSLDHMDKSLCEFITDADVFIYDSTYTDEEYPRFASFGHSTWQEGTRLANAANVKTFVAFHHDPDHDDAFMDQVAVDLEEARPGSVVAQEGMVLRP
jgi:phosphoribosyl 1,2-cyclic phosphodiesterase